MNCIWPRQFERSNLSKHYLICSFPVFTCVSTPLQLVLFPAWSHLTFLVKIAAKKKNKNIKHSAFSASPVNNFPCLLNSRLFPHLPHIMKYVCRSFLILLSAPCWMCSPFSLDLPGLGPTSSLCFHPHLSSTFYMLLVLEVSKELMI